MKTLLLLFGLAPATSHAALLHCASNNVGPVAATLYQTENFGLAAVATDNYDSTQNFRAKDGENHLMSCTQVTARNEVTCTGQWNFSSFHGDPTKLVTLLFSANDKGVISVTFERSPLFGSKEVTLVCKPARD